MAQLQKSTRPGKVGRWRQLESLTLTRAFFMICIVALHLDTFVYSANWGAAYFLFMLCGYSAMRFQWPEISRTGKIDTILGTVVRVAIPTVLVTIAMQLWARNFELKPLLLISNWFDPNEYQVAYYYFAEIYMQLLLVIAALLSIPSIRDILRKHPMISCTVLLIIAKIVNGMVESVWDTNYIYHRTPIWYLWTVAAGMLMASARDLQSRIAAMAIVAIAVVHHHGLTSASAYILSGSALLLFWPELSVPSSIKTTVSKIAGSSMFMYLSHYQVKSVIIRLFHGPMPWLALFTAIGFGIVFAQIYTWFEGKVRTFMSTHGSAGRLHNVFRRGPEVDLPPLGL